MNKKLIIVWILQIVVIAILGPAAYDKFVGGPNSIYVFTELGMEPLGRIIIGIIEATACFLLLTNHTAAVGAVLSVGTMLGAVIAHATYLGIDVNFDEGKHFILLIVVLLSSNIILFMRRKQLPIIGDTM